MLWVLLLVLLLGGVALVLQDDVGTIAGLDPSSFAGLVVGGALLLFVGLSVLGSYRGRLGHAARDLATWVALVLVLVGGYSYREELIQVARRVTGELLPPGESVVVDPAGKGDAAVRIRRRGDGHFVARAAVNGATVSLMVDTGATTVVLSPADARSAGIDVDRLTYSVPVQTANGTAYAASVRLRNIGVGPIRIEGVEALVARPGTLKESLLGMSFLRRLRSYEFSGEFLTLRS